MRFGLADGFREVKPHAALQKTIDYGKKLPRAVHPSVWTRTTGEKVLHVSPWMAEGIEGDEARIMHRTTIEGDYGLGYFEGHAVGDKILEMTV